MDDVKFMNNINISSVNICKCTYRLISLNTHARLHMKAQIILQLFIALSIMDNIIIYLHAVPLWPSTNIVSDYAQIM